MLDQKHRVCPLVLLRFLKSTLPSRGGITHMHALIRVRLRQALIRRDTRPVDLHSTRIHMILIHTLALHRVGSLRAGQAGQTASTHGMKPTSFQHCGSCLLLFSSPLQGDVSVLSFCVSFCPHSLHRAVCSLTQSAVCAPTVQVGQRPRNGSRSHSLCAKVMPKVHVAGQCKESRC